MFTILSVVFNSYNILLWAHWPWRIKVAHIAVILGTRLVIGWFGYSNKQLNGFRSFWNLMSDVLERAWVLTSPQTLDLANFKTGVTIKTCRTTEVDDSSFNAMWLSLFCKISLPFLHCELFVSELIYNVC